MFLEVNNLKQVRSLLLEVYSKDVINRHIASRMTRPDVCSTSCPSETMSRWSIIFFAFSSFSLTPSTQAWSTRTWIRKTAGLSQRLVKVSLRADRQFSLLIQSRKQVAPQSRPTLCMYVTVFSTTFTRPSISNCYNSWTPSPELRHTFETKQVTTKIEFCSLFTMIYLYFRIFEV